MGFPAQKEPNMTAHFSLDQVDASGDLRESAEAAGALDRRSLLRKGALTGGGALATAGIFSTMLSPAEAAIVSGKHSLGNDVAILKYALLLEQLESAFYNQGIKNITFASPQNRFFARVVAEHEKNHVDTLS